jgi:hypothetical protein
MRPPLRKCACVGVQRVWATAVARPALQLHLGASGTNELWPRVPLEFGRLHRQPLSDGFALAGGGRGRVLLVRSGYQGRQPVGMYVRKNVRRNSSLLAKRN